MQLGHSVFLFCIALLVQSCVSLHGCPALQQAKVTFESGNYQSAFHQLLPIADAGNAEAQYALGYLYYYGFGAPQDNESGVFWINKSAKQGYVPAIQALDRIHASHQTITASTTTRQTETSFHSIMQQPVNTSPSSIDMTFDNTRFTVELFGSHQLSLAQRLQNQLNLSQHAHLWHTQYRGKDWYVLSYGEFNTVQEAIVAKNDLSDELPQLKPWVRATVGLQQA